MGEQIGQISVIWLFSPFISDTGYKCVFQVGILAAVCWQQLLWVGIKFFFCFSFFFFFYVLMPPLSRMAAWQETKLGWSLETIWSQTMYTFLAGSRPQTLTGHFYCAILTLCLLHSFVKMWTLKVKLRFIDGHRDCISIDTLIHCADWDHSLDKWEQYKNQQLSLFGPVYGVAMMGGFWVGPCG